jgi:hypothetical protein
MSSSRTAALFGTAALIGGGLIAAAPASASVVGRDHYVDNYNETFEACGTSINVQGTTAGHYVARLRGGQPLANFTDHFVDRATYTNLATGRSWSVVSNLTHVDTATTVVEGTVVQQTSHEAGTFSVYDGNGVLAYRQSGIRKAVVVIDTMGTADDEDDQVLQFDAQVSGHFPDSDFCDDVAAFTT